MELQPDAVRDILCYLIDHTNIRWTEDRKYEFMVVHEQQVHEDFADRYEPDQVTYTLLKLHEARLIAFETNPALGNVQFGRLSIKDVTWEGHQFAQNIQSDTVWENTKRCAAKLGIKSIEGLLGIAKQAMMLMISNPETRATIMQYFGIM